MVPAMYFLARQVSSRRVATIAAAMTACSAFLLVYSRDAKMYMELWFAAALFVACLLWWMRTGQRMAWLAWVAAACAMNGLHALGLCVLAAGVLIVLAHPMLTRRRLLLALLGTTISVSGVAGYYACFNSFVRKIEAGGWHSSGVSWVGVRNRQFSKPMLLWDTAATWTFAYRSPRPPVTPPTRVIVPVSIVSAILGICLIGGALPWPPRLRDDDPHEAPFGGRGALWMALWLVLPMLGFAIGAVVTGRDVWSARYLGIIWPPMIVLMALAFQRLPHPALRFCAIALFIGANLLQFGLRMTAQTSMPLDLVAADVAAARTSDGEVRTVIAIPHDTSENSLNGAGGVFEFPGRYYLSLATGKRLTPAQFWSHFDLNLFDLPTDYRAVPAGVARLIVWEDDQKVDVENDPVLRSLGPAWSRQSSTEYAVRDFWCWRRLFRCHRSVYVRAEAAPPIQPPAPKNAKKKKRA
jgi:hypothetical protein